MMQTQNVIQDINMYKVFSVASGYGITTWDRRLVFDPKCVTPPDIETLEEYGYTFVKLYDGYNIINSKGKLLLDETVKDIAWLIRSKVVGLVEKDGTEGLFFLKEKRFVRNITDFSLEQQFIQTFKNEAKGLTTYSGVEVFKPAFSAVAIFEHHIYIAYRNDGSAILNSPYWEAPTKRAERFENLAAGILAKFSTGKYEWINPKTGKILKLEEQTQNQKKLLELAKKKEELQ